MTSKMKSLARLALAFAVSPLVAASALDSWGLVVDWLPAMRAHAIPPGDNLLFCYIVVAACGLPLAGLFALLGWNHWSQYTGTGFVLGVGLMILGYRFVAGDAAQTIDWVRTLIIGLTAALTALAFWWARYAKLGRLGAPAVSKAEKP